MKSRVTSEPSSIAGSRREEVLSALHTSDKDAPDGIGDLMFGDYCRLLEAPHLWNKLGLHDDRAIFVKQLHEVRKVRNGRDALQHY